MFKTLLIANRGEIACRIIKTARRLGIKTVAVYSTLEANALHVQLADAAWCIGPPPATNSYLNIPAIMNAAIQSGAEAIHPGYGFLSEHPDFARACANAGIVFVGPSISALEITASKQLAKQLLETSDGPLTPGYHGQDQSDARLLHEARALAFPVLLKAANGGGGKGMRAVHHEADFDAALAGARREAMAFFADDTMLIEKLIQNARHIEIQIMADNHGQCVHLFERDCSMQRRHQKIIEEAPAPVISTALRQGLTTAALAVARAIEYRGAGTVEFLVDNQEHFYFMEMNTRLQVEHPVTEMVTGLDLVEWQLRLAANEPLPCGQEAIHCQGHAIECRIYAEDPRQQFIPSAGTINALQEPKGDGLRLDSGVIAHSEVTTYFDPMVAKLIAWGETREQALARMQQGLSQYYIDGIKTNIPFLQTILSHPDCISAQIVTDFLSQTAFEIPSPNPTEGLWMAACVDYVTRTTTSDALEQDTLAWQMHLAPHWPMRYVIDNTPHTLLVTPIDAHTLTIQYHEQRRTFRVQYHHPELILDDGTHCQKAWVVIRDKAFFFYTPQGVLRVDAFQGKTHRESETAHSEGPLVAPMSSTIVAILKNKGDRVKAGERLLVLEAMKMEHTIHAPRDGLLTDIFYDVGAQVHEGAELMSLDTVVA